MTAQELKNSILMRAVQGKLVPQDPSDEPASVLLAKIREEKEQMMKEGKIKKEAISEIYVDPSDNQHYEKIGNTVKCIEDEIPFEIPESWEWVRLNALGEIVGGGTPKTSNSEFWDGNIPWLTPADMKYISGKYASKGQRMISVQGLSSSSAKLMPKNSILFSSRAPIGYIAISKNEICTNQGFKSLVPVCPSIVEYVYYAIVQRTKEIQSRASGTTFKEISGAEFGLTIIPLPPLEEQGKIVTKIEELLLKVDDYETLATNSLQIENTFPSKLKKSILQYAIQGKLVPQDPNDEPASVLLERIRKEKEQLIKDGKIKRDKNESYIYRGSDNSYYLRFNGENVIVDNELPFDIPENWTWCTLQELVTYQNGYAFSKSNFTADSKRGIPVIKSNNIMTLEVKINNKTDYVVNPNEKMLSSAIHKGDLLMCLSSQSSNTEPLGKTALYTWDSISLLNQRVLKLTPINAEITEYLYWLINSEYFHYTVSHRSGGSAQSNLKMEHVLTMPMPIPPINEQKRIINSISHISKMVG